MRIAPLTTLSHSLAARLPRRAIIGRFGAAALTATGVTAPNARAAAQEATPTAGPGRVGYLVIRRYHLESDAPYAELTQQVEATLVPIIREVPSFVESLLVEPGGGEHVSLSLFTDQAGADESTKRAAGWAEQHVADLVEVPAFEVIAGPVRLDVTAASPSTPVP